ncbi:MAG: VWA domain-containing protein [Gemmatimonadetes bacterium]|nr:VWA domain-containing protein [Gemmatimonadota bacterium]
MTLEWGSPLWLVLLPAVPLYLHLLRRRPGAAVSYPRTAALRAGSPAMRWIAVAPDLLRAVTLCALIIGLARPRTPGATIEERGEGVPIVIALDISSSMLAEDFRPRNRLTVAKQNIARFISGREGDPIGLVAFAAEAITLVPITTYDPVLTNALRTLQVGLLEDGTAIGDGLAIAVNRLRMVRGRSRVIILMSDGESNRGEVEPLAAARAAATYGIRVYTIGVGSEGVARVPVAQDAAGIRYAELPVGIDETLLREIADVTGGTYFRATDPRALADVYARIDLLVKDPVQTRRRVQYSEWYLILLGIAGAALVSEWAVRGSRWGVVPG